ncbi:MAG: hypothetical protein JNL84_00565, partial [Candidatus Accumulibacter sp.]|nr:hypothetical protein [Accumulibacter sp.]
MFKLIRLLGVSMAIDKHNLEVVENGFTVDNHRRSEIGRRIRVARESLGLTQDGLAKAVKGSKRGIQDNETRFRVPGGEVIAGLIDLGISANWLLSGVGPMRIADQPAESEQDQSPKAINYELEKEKKTLVINQDQATYDGGRDILEAVLRVGEYKIANDQVTRAVIEFGLSGAPHWLEAARNYPDLE